MPHFATARIPTPLFNTTSLTHYLGGRDGSSVHLDAQELMRCVETVLLPHTKIQLLQKIPQSPLWQVTTEEYPYPGDCFVHEQSLQLHTTEPTPRTVQLPSEATILHMAELLTGTRYIWGGNWPLGVPQLTEWFRPHQPLSTLAPLTQDTWQLRGVDCSGLLYFLTDGYTPRNTSQLLHFGQAVQDFHPLDLIVYKGHVILVLNHTTTIESRALRGVVQTPLQERLAELADIPFTIRRWYPPSPHSLC